MSVIIRNIKMEGVIGIHSVINIDIDREIFEECLLRHIDIVVTKTSKKLFNRGLYKQETPIFIRCNIEDCRFISKARLCGVFVDCVFTGMNEDDFKNKNLTINCFFKSDNKDIGVIEKDTLPSDHIHDGPDTDT